MLHVCGTTINSDNVNITGGTIRMQGESEEQLIRLKALPVAGSATCVSSLCPTGLYLDSDMGSWASITSSSVYIENDYGQISVQPIGIHTRKATVFYSTGDGTNISWGDYATNTLKGTWYGTVFSSSDKNKKHCIEALDEKYKVFFDSLEPVRFIYNDQEDELYSMGFIAQDVAKAVEGAGLTLDDFAGHSNVNGNIALDYTQFTSLNTMMLQETRKELKETKQELKEIKDELSITKKLFEERLLKLEEKA